MLKLRKKEIPYEEIEIHWDRLAFYPENPRIYSQFAGSEERTQENIQAKLEAMEHVKELRSLIDSDGQVNDPLFCMEVSPESELHGLKDYLVLEGNSRLAALGMSKKGSLPPTHVPCNILDFSAYGEQETEGLIFTLLGGFHITGKTNWRSYENGAYIYRRFHNHRVAVDDIAKEITMTPAKVRSMVAAFQMMIDADDTNTSHWSYYEAYVGSTKLRNAEANIPGLRDRVVQLIKEDKFPRALDMRDKLPAILNTKTARRIFLDKKEPDAFAEALAEADISGSTDIAYKRLQRFRVDIAKKETYGQLVKLVQSTRSRDRTIYELAQIEKNVNRLLKRKVKMSK
jgi:hypothetical protein